MPISRSCHHVTGPKCPNCPPMLFPSSTATLTTVSSAIASMVHRLAVRLARARVSPRVSTKRFASSATPSAKIKAVPFNLSPSTALSSLHPAGLLATATIANAALAFLLRMFGPRVLDLAREFGFGSDLRLREIKAVYWPIWRVDLGATGTVRKAKSGKEGEGWLGVREGFVPGHSFAPLSYISYAIPPLQTPLPTYNPAKDLRQLGEGFGIVPVPFEISPVDVVDRIRKEIGRRTEWEGWRIDERDWKEEDMLLACYPIYFPIYVADFEHRPGGFGPEAGPGEGRRITITMDAHDERVEDCRVNMPMPPQVETKEYFYNPAPYLPTLSFILPSAPSISPLPQRAATGSPSYAALFAQKFQEYIHPPRPKDGEPLAMPLASLRTEINWEDVRIQDWNGIEREENEEYLIKAGERATTLGMLQSLRSMESKLPTDGSAPASAMVLSPGSLNPNKFEMPSLVRKPIGEIRKEMEDDLRKKEQALERSKPAWWVKWLESRKKA